MPNVTLAGARVKALSRRDVVYDIHDGKLKDFGVRVLPPRCRDAARCLTAVAMTRYSRAMASEEIVLYENLRV